MLNLKKEIGKNSLSSIVISELTDTHKIARYAAQHHKKICYVNCSRPYQSLLVDFKINKINSSPFFFIDCITKTVVKKPKKEKKVIFISKPTAYEEIKKTVCKLLQQKQCDLLIFDSISSLLVYKKDVMVTMFLHGIMAMMKGFHCPAIFLLHSEDVEKKTIKQLGVVVDKIVYLK